MSLPANANATAAAPPAAAAAAAVESGSATPVASEAVQRARLSTALWACWIADALAMPAHWMYDHAAQQQSPGEIRGYLPAREPHVDSYDYMQHVHPEREQAAWPFRLYHNHAELLQVPGTHYHHAMPAGSNTLHARIQEVAMSSIVQQAAADAANQTRESDAAAAPPSLPYNHLDCSRRLVVFLTSPGTHPDTYIGGALRHFFQQLALDPAVQQCTRDTFDPATLPASSFEGKGYDDPCVGGLVLIIPMLLLLARAGGGAGGDAGGALQLEARLQVLRAHLYLTHSSALLYAMCVEMLELVAALLRRRQAGPGRTDEAQRLLRRSLLRMIQANVDSTRDAQAVCGLPGVKMSKKAAAAAAAPEAVLAAAAPSASPSQQDPVYLAWKASQVPAPNAKALSMEEVMAMSQEQAFAQLFSVRCYAERALPAALYLALKACEQADAQARARESSSNAAATPAASVPHVLPAALLHNANLGGDNAHRGQVLGLLLGLVFGQPEDSRAPEAPCLPPEWKTQLRANDRPGEHAQLAHLFDQFVEVCMNVTP